MIKQMSEISVETPHQTPPVPLPFEVGFHVPSTSRSEEDQVLTPHGRAMARYQILW